MHIAIVTHSVKKGDGQSRVNYEITWEAIRRGIDVTLVSSSVDAQFKNIDGVRWARIPVSHFPTLLLKHQSFAFRSYRYLIRHLDQFDLVVANGCITWLPSDINIVHFVHSAWLRSPVHTSKVQHGPYAWYQYLYTRWNARWERYTFKQANRLIAVSKQVEQELTALGLPSSKIEVIYNGVDTDEFGPGSVDTFDTGIPREAYIGVFVGDLKTPRKNLDTVLKAIRDFSNLHLVVVGSAEGSPYPTMAQDLGINERVHFLGYRRDVPDIMRIADFCVCPSRYEPFSLVALEALATGLPVITSQNVGAAELIPDACGVVVEDPNDVNGLVEAMERILTTDRERIGPMARSTAQQHNFSKMAKDYISLFEDML